MKSLVILIFAWSLSFLFPNSASAQEWVMCGNCVSDAQFEYAAKERHGERRGWSVLAVANPYTSTFRWVEVVYTPPGEVVMRSPAKADLAQPVRKNIQGLSIFDVAPVANPLITVPSDVELASTSMSSKNDGGSSADVLEPSTAERLQFEAIVSISRDQVFFKPSNSQGYFNDLRTAYRDYNAALDSAIRVALATNNPAWNGLALGPQGALMSALKSIFGRGPTGCVTFDNGDVGCFQVNMLYPGSARLVEGTAKDVAGNTINEDGVPASGGGVSVHPDTPTVGDVTYIAGNSRMVCGYVMGQLDSCFLVIR